MDVKINLKICYAKIPSNPSHANFLSCERSFNNTMTQNMGMTTHHLREIGSLRFGVFSKPHETTNFQKIRSFKKCVQKKKITGMSFLKVNDRFHLYKKVRFHVRYDGRSVWIFQLSTFWVFLKSTLGHLRMLIDTLIGMRPSKAPVINCWAIKTSAIIAVFLVTRTTLNIPWFMSSTLSFWCRYIRMENEDHDLFWLRSCGGS